MEKVEPELAPRSPPLRSKLWHCAVCRPLNHETTSATLAALLSSAQRCYLCAFLVLAISEFRPGIGKTAHQDPDATVYIDWGSNLTMPGSLDCEPVQLECPSLDLRLEVLSMNSYYAPGTRPQCGDRISGDTGSDTCAFKVAQWLLDCMVNHKCGNVRSKDVRPSRLLYIGRGGGFSEDGDWTVSLKDYPNITDKVTPRTPEYACLSYCWGGVSDMTTTARTLYSKTLGIDWESLPTTFQHAIEFARRLQIKYLWVDALCIIQDDPEDWQRESSRMGEIYSNAVFTISAMTGSNNRAGLFSRSPLGTAPAKLIVFPKDEGAQHSFLFQELLPHRGMFFSDHNYFSGMTSQECDLFPLLRRGWVLQERLLSRRIVHFTPHEVVWECAETGHCECGNKAGRSSEVNAFLLSPETGPSEKDHVKSRMRWWHDKVEIYSKLDLTFQHDKLPALSGIAKGVQRLIGGQYLAGIWSTDLWNELRWSIHNFEGHDRWFNKPLRARRAPKYQGPSWSWVSLDGGFDGLYFPYDSDSRALGTDGRYVETLEISCTPIGVDLFGQVVRAHMLLSGFVAPCRLRYPLEDHAMEERTLSDLHYRYYVELQSCNVPIFADYPFNEPGPHHIPEGSRLFCLRIGKAKWNKKEYRTGPSGNRTSHYTPVWRAADLLVLRRLEQHPPEQPQQQRWPERNDSNIWTYERVGLLSGFSTLLQGSAPGLLRHLTEEADEEIFKDIKRSVIRLI